MHFKYHPKMLLSNSTHFTCRKTLYYRVFLADNLSLSLSTSLNLYELICFLNLLSIFGKFTDE